MTAKIIETAEIKIPLVPASSVPVVAGAAPQVAFPSVPKLQLGVVPEQAASHLTHFLLALSQAASAVLHEQAFYPVVAAV